MKTILRYILNLLARGVLKKYHPEVVGITGSVGKTSTKEAVYAVLSGQFNTRRTLKNYNNELGLPLTVFEAETGGRSLSRWLKVFVRAFGLLVKRDKNYPEILVLEMGADHPGDIKYLTDLAPCKVGVITAIGPTHVEFFKTVRKIAQEKQIIITHLKRDGTAVLNADDALIAPMRARTDAEVITYGFGDSVDLQVVEVKIDQEMVEGILTTRGTLFKMRYGGSLVPVFLPGVVGRQHVYAALAGAAVGLAYGLNLVEVAERLRLYQAPPSRMRLVEGIKYTMLIDDSYNSSPLAAAAALDVMKEMKAGDGGRKIVVLGDMLELGTYTEESHRQIGRKVVDVGTEFLVTVGERAKIIAEEAKAKGLTDDKIAKFGASAEAGKFLQEKIEAGDLILIKGSQGVRMEKITKELMADPLDADKLVCRQDENWKK